MDGGRKLSSSIWHSPDDMYGEIGEESSNKKSGSSRAASSDLLFLDQLKRARLDRFHYEDEAGADSPRFLRNAERAGRRSSLVADAEPSAAQRLHHLARQIDSREIKIRRQTELVQTLRREAALREHSRREREAIRLQMANLDDLRAGRLESSLPSRFRPTGHMASPSRSAWRLSQQTSDELNRPSRWEDEDVYLRNPNKATQQDSKPPPSSPGSKETAAEDDLAAEIRPSRRPEPGEGLNLALPSDKAILSDFQILLRKSLEFFEVQPIDQINGIPGRKKELEVGQVGIRCRYCAHRPPHWRGRGAVYYPRSLGSVYQAAQNMGMNHFLKSCMEMPESVKEAFDEARQKQKQEIRRSGGKTYWTETSRHMGLEEREGHQGMWFKKE